MTYTYEIPKDENGDVIKNSILRSDGAWIPKDENNSDYQTYLDSLEAPAKK
jgi:hypothetical protein